MRLFRHLIGAAIVAAAFAACNLNPQPLPPKDDDGDRASGESDGGNFLPATPPQDSGASDFGSDAGTGNNPTDAAPPPQPGTDSGTPDGGDAGDAGDAGDSG
jgi:hypothetical protein